MGSEQFRKNKLEDALNIFDNCLEYTKILPDLFT